MRQLTMFSPTFDNGSKTTICESTAMFEVKSTAMEFELPIITLQKKVERTIKSPVKRITCPEDAVRIFGEFKDRPNEHFVAIYLNTKNIVIGVHVISIGNVDSAPVSVGEVYRPALVCGAISVIIGHNHPSGDPTPSPEDVNVTRLLKEAGELLEVNLLDHLIFGSDGRWTSLKERGII